MTTIKRKTIPVMEGLWQEDENGKPHLMGSQCTACSEVFFPRKEMNFCSHCHKDALSEITFSGEGRVTAFTKVERQPAGGFYKGSVPYTYGIVQLDEGVNIYSQLVDDSAVVIGRKVELIIEKFYEEDEKDVMIFKFRAKRSSERVGEDE